MGSSAEGAEDAALLVSLLFGIPRRYPFSHVASDQIHSKERGGKQYTGVECSDKETAFRGAK